MLHVVISSFDKSIFQYFSWTQTECETQSESGEIPQPTKIKKTSTERHLIIAPFKTKSEILISFFCTNDFKNTEHCETPHTDAPDQIDGENQESLGHNDDEFNFSCESLFRKP